VARFCVENKMHDTRGSGSSQVKVMRGGEVRRGGLATHFDKMLGSKLKIH